LFSLSVSRSLSLSLTHSVSLSLSLSLSLTNHVPRERPGQLVEASGFTAFGVGSFVFRVSGLGSRVSGFGFRVSGFGFRVSGFGFRVSGLGFQVSGFRFRVSHFGITRERARVEEKTEGQDRFQAKREQLKPFQVFSPESQGQNLVLTALHVLCILVYLVIYDSGWVGRCPLSIFCSRGTPPRDDSTAGGGRTVPPLRRNVKRFRGGLVFKAHRLLYHSTLALSVTKTREKHRATGASPGRRGGSCSPPPTRGS